VNSAQVGVLEKGDEERFDALLQGTNGRALEAEIDFEFVGNLSDKALEGKLADQELGRFLVATDLAQSNSA